MTKLPYGFDPKHPYAADDAWMKLRTVREYLEDGEPIPPDLALWLGEAIRHSSENPAEFLRRLSLKRSRGRVAQSGDAWAEIGAQVCRLEDEGAKPEVAIATVLAECNEAYSRSQLQKWRDQYRVAFTRSQAP